MPGKHREPQRFASLLSSLQNTTNSFLINSSKSDSRSQEKKLVGFLDPNSLCCLSPSSHRKNKIKMHGQIYPNPTSSADTILALNPFCFFPVEFARFENLELLRASREDDVELFFRAVNPKETKKQIPPSTPSPRNPKLRQKSRILPSDGSTFNLFVSYNLGTVITYVHHPIQTLITKFRHMFLKYVSILWGPSLA